MSLAHLHEADTEPVEHGEQKRLEDRLLGRLRDLLDDLREELSELWPDYAAWLDKDQEGTEQAATLFVDRLVAISGPGSPSDRGQQTVQLVFEQIGRGQFQAGDDLTRLLTAFQVGSQVAWRHVSAAALAEGLGRENLAALANAVFVFVNRLCLAAAHGYVLQQAEDARGLERSREELAGLLLSDRASVSAVQVAAARARWRIPKTAAVVLVDPEDKAAQGVLDRLGSSCLRLRERDRQGAIVPDPTGSAGRAYLSRQLQGANAVVGHPVPLERLPRSAQVAQILAGLQRAGTVEGDPVFAADHLDTVIVCRDPRLVEALRRQVLAPLDEVPSGSRARLVETLASWLRHQGNTQAIAHELSVHPQTVRYRLAKLQELLGDDLADPRSRARMFLALEWPFPASPPGSVG